MTYYDVPANNLNAAHRVVIFAGRGNGGAN
jgi:hypothetical protein